MDIARTASLIAGGDRRTLARAITLVESSRPADRARALDLLARLGPRDDALRVGLTGTPGVGKSSFVEAFGLHLTGQGRRVAVLAVDPSSARTGGSILGDRTRMERLARDPAAYVRASPAQGHAGGVARRTREAVALVEAAGFDTVLVETVGVGQSETLVAGLTDLFVLLLAPAGGDELQGVKRGIVELADLILVTKGDGDLAPAALRTCADYAGALRLLRRREGDPEGYPRACVVSAHAGRGIAEAWGHMQALATHRRATGFEAARRAAQVLEAHDADLRAEILARLTGQGEVARAMAEARAALAAGTLTPREALARVLARLPGMP